MKSYGRAPTFLMMTGYEQVRSIACELTDDAEGARTVQLILPQTGVCSSQPAFARLAGELPVLTPRMEGGCCGGPAPAGADACCVADADAKSAGLPGCGCS